MLSSSPQSGSPDAAPSPAAAPRTPRLPHVPLWLLALFTFSGTLAMHIFVPALPMAGQDLHAGSAAMQLTVSLYILGLAGGQLIYGPLSDRFGRRPVLMVGLVIYTVAGLAAALAPQVYALIAARLFQALGGCAGLVLGRAIVRDTATSAEAAKRLAMMSLMVTIAPGLAPIVGGALAGWLGWRAVLFSLCLLGAANFILAWRMLPETCGGLARISMGTLWRHYRQLLTTRAFVGYAVGGACATTSMYAFVATAPYIFVGQLQRPPDEVGFYLAVLVSGVWLGSMVTSRLIGKMQMQRLMQAGNLLSAVSALIYLGVVVSGSLAVAPIVACMFFFTLGCGMAGPIALTLSVGVNPLIIGSASGLYGAIQMVVGALCAALPGLGSSPALASALVMAGAGVLGQLMFRIACRPRAT
ncbi:MULTISPECIES: multidrug effflux MFS transporter [unclassified Bordetella]|uniref:multidrug effflux MFS transporter n=1 Tax=unclassified Bordetella TaxID=2630031 RepID=UPI001323A3A0|nr:MULTISPECIES: multidrug effflux MFS transporter [unclassified Bordetella]MVW72063.1 Bcr/CflA family efflux MFS transporter [Bordetella sp. 15P40C-2]MVW78776.1 Bcr/CflA family efflux MFS transporter [Bordetella sp. 02P26C-1]